MAKMAAFQGGNGSAGFNNVKSVRHEGYGQDEFEATQRVRLQLDAVASENLSGTVHFEIGQQRWGMASEGGALGADGNVVKLKNAYIDFMIPDTDARVRMGIQKLGLPSYTMHASQIFNGDVAGISANVPINENIGITAFWARLLDDNFDSAQSQAKFNTSGRAGYMDNVDLFALSLPITLDGISITPFGAYTMIGSNAVRMYQTSDTGPYMPYVHAIYPYGHRSFSLDDSQDLLTGLFPIGGARMNNGVRAGEKITGYGNAWWAGIAADITAFDPWHFAIDFNYGSVTWDNSRLNQHGWVASGLLEYKLDWAIPGIYGWYASGENGDLGDGSERMPYLDVSEPTNEFAYYAFNGDMPLNRASSQIGKGVTGTWGIGVRLKDFSFLEDLSHTLRAVFIGGTNSPTMGRKVPRFAGVTDGLPDTRLRRNSNFWVGMDGEYLTTHDCAMEISMNNTYKMYENFSISLDAGYVALWLDQSDDMWGYSIRNGKDDTVRDMWNINLLFAYSF